MGGAPSKPPPIIREDPSPNQVPVDGIGVGGQTQSCQVCQNERTKQGCSACKFYIGQGLSASSAKLYRESGNVTQQQCNEFSEDLRRVENNELAFDQLRARLINGKYFQNLNNGYCGRLMVKAGEESNLVNKDSLNGRLIQPEILKMTVGGGYSSLTKLFIKPSVPFNIRLNGITETVETMTLFHPAPLRVENVQYDAVLTLNDTADTTKKLVALIPLKGSLKPGEGGRFLAKIASHIPGILRPNPATNQYESIDVPTGNDWDLSRMFPGKPDAATKQTATTDGFFTWNAVPPVERYLKRKQVFGNAIPVADTYEYGWRPVPGATSPMYVMLQNPIEVNVFDLQTIRMLPVTPTEDAMPPPLLPTVTYTPPTQCKSNALLTGKKETFENSDGKCDPFAALQPVSMITKDDIFAAVMGVLTAVAVFVGLYYALKYASDNNWGTKIQSWGRQFGKYMATAPPPGSDTAPAPAPAPPAAPSTGPVRRAPTRSGEDFTFTNEAAIELRRRKKEEQEELARLKKEADEAAAKAKAEEAAELELLKKQAEEAESRLARPAATGPSKSVATRSGEDFAFTSPMAERQRQRREEQAEMARLKKEADAAARRAAETERLRGDAAGTGLLRKEELETNTARAQKAAEEAELARLQADANEDEEEARINAARAARIAKRKQMTPLERAEDDLKLARKAVWASKDALGDREMAVSSMETYYDSAKKSGNSGMIATAKQNLDRAKKEEDDARARIAEAEAEVEKLTAQIAELRAAPPAKQLKRRTILSSDRDLTAEEKEEKKKNEEMVARALQPQKDYDSRKPASTASASSSSAAPPPTESAKKKAEIDAKLEALEQQLVEIEKRKEETRMTLRRVVDARNKSKTLRASLPKVPSQAEREIDRVKAETDTAVKEVGKAATAASKEASQGQAQANKLLDMARQFKDKGLSDRTKALLTEFEEADAAATKSKEEAEAEREKVARDLAAAQSRLRQSQMLYNRATQRRNLTTGRGRTQRKR